jgi:hypothetical protein
MNGVLECWSAGPSSVLGGTSEIAAGLITPLLHYSIAPPLLRAVYSASIPWAARWLLQPRGAVAIKSEIEFMERKKLRVQRERARDRGKRVS